MYKRQQYSHGAGCGCKISPKVLETILHSEQAKFVDPNLLVGNETRDDAAVYDLGNGTSVISTTDFFMPIVDKMCIRDRDWTACLWPGFIIVYLV